MWSISAIIQEDMQTEVSICNPFLPPLDESAARGGNKTGATFKVLVCKPFVALNGKGGDLPHDPSALLLTEQIIHSI